MHPLSQSVSSSHTTAIKTRLLSLLTVSEYGVKKEYKDDVSSLVCFLVVLVCLVCICISLREKNILGLVLYSPSFNAVSEDSDDDDEGGRQKQQHHEQHSILGRYIKCTCMRFVAWLSYC